MHKATHMSNMAHRHRRAAQKNSAQAVSSKKEYVILDSSHKPDLRGEFAGAKVTRIGSRHTVWLSDKTARFYLDSASIELAKKEPVKAAAPVVTRASLKDAKSE